MGCLSTRLDNSLLVPHQTLPCDMEAELEGMHGSDARRAKALDENKRLLNIHHQSCSSTTVDLMLCYSVLAARLGGRFYPERE